MCPEGVKVKGSHQRVLFGGTDTRRAPTLTLGRDLRPAPVAEILSGESEQSSARKHAGLKSKKPAPPAGPSQPRSSSQEDLLGEASWEKSQLPGAMPLTARIACRGAEPGAPAPPPPQPHTVGGAAGGEGVGGAAPRQPQSPPTAGRRQGAGTSPAWKSARCDQNRQVQFCGSGTVLLPCFKDLNSRAPCDRLHLFSHL